MGNRILVVGDVNVDVVLGIGALPSPGGEVEAPRAEVRLGGGAANVALWLSWLGIEVRVLARVGFDPFGDFVLKSLFEAGVDIDSVQRDPGLPTGIVVVFVGEGGERSMISVPGANAHLEARYLDLSYLSWIHVSGYFAERKPEAAAELLSQALAKGIPWSLDTVPFKALVHIPRFLGLRPAILFGTEDELRGLEGGGERFVKLGKRGCLYIGERGELHVPGFEVEARDTTGAGDAFCAGVLAARLEGAPPEVQGLLGNLCGALRASGYVPPDIPVRAVEELLGRLSGDDAERLGTLLWGRRSR